MREGLYGQVWRALDQRLDDRPVAIKCPLPRQKQHGEKLEREARLLSGLIHPNLLYIIDFFVEEGSPFLVREWIDGRPLAMVVEESLPPLDQIALWADQLASALHYMHTRSKPILLLDMTPLNIVVDTFGNIHLTEFGLARYKGETVPEGMRGLHKPHFASPEQARGDDVDDASDQYLMAAVIWYLLTGRTPSQPVTAPGELRPEIAPSLDRALLKMLSPVAHNRYASVGDARSVLSLVFTERPGTEFEWLKLGKPADLRLRDEPLPHLNATYQGRPARVLWLNVPPYDTLQEPERGAEALVSRLRTLPSLHGVIWPVDVARRVASHGFGAGTLLAPPAFLPLVGDKDPQASFEGLAHIGIELLQVVDTLLPLRDSGVMVETDTVFVDHHHHVLAVLPDVVPPELVPDEPTPFLTERLLFSLFFGRDPRTFKAWIEGDSRRWQRAPETLKTALQAGLLERAESPERDVWLRLLQRIIDRAFHCPHCNEEIFYQDGMKECPACAGAVRAPMLMQVGGDLMVLKPGVKVYRHHLNASVPFDTKAPVAVIAHHNHRLVAENTSDATWQVQSMDSGTTTVAPHHKIALEEGRCIEFRLAVTDGLPPELAAATAEIV